MERAGQESFADRGWHRQEGEAGRRSPVTCAALQSGTVGHVDRSAVTLKGTPPLGWRWPSRSASPHAYRLSWLEIVEAHLAKVEALLLLIRPRPDAAVAILNEARRAPNRSTRRARLCVLPSPPLGCRSLRHRYNPRRDICHQICDS